MNADISFLAMFSSKICEKIILFSKIFHMIKSRIWCLVGPLEDDCAGLPKNIITTRYAFRKCILIFGIRLAHQNSKWQ